jgi:hypothetical protein
MKMVILFFRTAASTALDYLSAVEAAIITLGKWLLTTVQLLSNQELRGRCLHPPPQINFFNSLHILTSATLIRYNLGYIFG